MLRARTVRACLWLACALAVSLAAPAAQEARLDRREDPRQDARQDPRTDPAPDPRAAAVRPAIAANDRFVFVLRDDVVYQFDAASLRFLRSTRLPAAPDADAHPRPHRDAVAEPREAPEPREPETAGEPVEQPVLQDVTEAAPTDAAGLRRAIDRGLEWLRRHQDKDGRWDADEFMKHDRDGAPCSGRGDPLHDVGVTGLATLAFLKDGHTVREGAHRDVVKRAVTWLHSVQDPANGLIGPNTAPGFVYDQAIATFALVESWERSEFEPLREPAQRAIDYLEWHRNPYGVWRYQPRDNDNDTSVTGWCVMAYAAAQRSGLRVNETALKHAATWLEQVTDPVTGRTGYSRRGGPSSRLRGQSDRFPPTANEAMTALALHCRYLLGQDPTTHGIMRSQAALVANKPPRWRVDEGTIDHCAWLFGTFAMAEVGGRHWRGWSRALRDTLVPEQRDDGNARGSWDPVGVWGSAGGRVYSTAASVLALAIVDRTAHAR